MTRTGIFLCTCDQEINKAVDVAQAVKALHASDGVVVEVPHVCLPEGLSGFKREIVANTLDRVVVAACPARLQARRLLEGCVDAGVNPNHFTLVDWREGCAWAHRGDTENATALAVDLVRMGLARVSHARPLDGVLTKIAPRVLVIGGGIAGMTAARTLAERNVDVTLVERQPELGGECRRVLLDGLLPAYQETLSAVVNHPRIQVELSSRIVKVTGGVGNYQVEIARTDTTWELQVGAVIVATGAREFAGAQKYRRDGRRVLTLGELERQMAAGKLTAPSSLVYILCAGSRDEKIPYCSNVCCLGALNQALRVKRTWPTAKVTTLFRDLYLLGDELNTEIVREARRAGIEFIRYAETNPPRVDDDFVEVHDTRRVRRWVGYDRVVLVTPLVPHEDAGVMARLFHLPRDGEGFFTDPHLRLRPEQRSDRGIFVCGSAHRPVDADTAILQGMTAAARAARFIQPRELMRPASYAVVNQSVCTGCAQCVEMCAFGAIEMRPPTQGSPGEILDRAEIDPFLCPACGNCVVGCPSKAIDLPTWSEGQILAQIEAALSRQEEGKEKPKDARIPGSPRPCVVVFGCQWSGFAAMELAGARRMQYSARVRVIELPCSARLDPMHVLYALLNGADAVLLALCAEGECHFGNGDRYAATRIENLRAQLTAHGIDPQRVGIARMMGDDAGAWVAALARYRLER